MERLFWYMRRKPRWGWLRRRHAAASGCCSATVFLYDKQPVLYCSLLFFSRYLKNPLSFSFFFFLLLVISFSVFQICFEMDTVKNLNNKQTPLMSETTTFEKVNDEFKPLSMLNSVPPYQTFIFPFKSNFSNWAASSHLLLQIWIQSKLLSLPTSHLDPVR